MESNKHNSLFQCGKTCNADGEPHSKDGKPSLVFDRGSYRTAIWHENGIVHRLDGPAEIVMKGARCAKRIYYVNGKQAQKHIKLTAEQRRSIVNDNHLFFDGENYTVIKEVPFDIGVPARKTKVYLTLKNGSQKFFIVTC